MLESKKNEEKPCSNNKKVYYIVMVSRCTHLHPPFFNNYNILTIHYIYSNFDYPFANMHVIYIVIKLIFYNSNNKILKILMVEFDKCVCQVTAIIKWIKEVYHKCTLKVHKERHS